MPLWLGRGTIASAAPPDPAQRSFWILAAIGLAQFAGASWVGRRLLRSPRRGAGSRVRSYFLLRGAAAEALGLFGLLAGMLRAPVAQTITLFALSFLCLLVSAPIRPAWEQARRVAESPDP